MNTLNASRARRLLAAPLGAPLPSLAVPPGAPAANFEEMIVTAQKREESAQDAGVAITAFSAEQMETCGFTDNMEIAAFTPGMYVSGDNAGQTSQFTMRGAAQNDAADLHEGPNAGYADEAYVAAGQGRLFANFDMERAAVLKGAAGRPVRAQRRRRAGALHHRPAHGGVRGLRGRRLRLLRLRALRGGGQRDVGFLVRQTFMIGVNR